MDIVTDILSNPGFQSAAATLLIPVVIQKIKTWTELQKTWVINVLVAAMAIITVALESLATNGAESYGEIGMRSAAILAAIQFVYPLIIKPASQVLEDAKAMRVARLNAGGVEIQSLPSPEDLPRMEFDPDLVEPVEPVENLDQ